MGESERTTEKRGMVGEKETGVRERGRKKRSDKGEREKIASKKNSWNFILPCFTPQNGVRHDNGL